MDIVSLILIGLCLILFYYLYNGAIYVPTNKRSVENIVSLINPSSGLKVVDLGSGDGRVVTALALAGANAVGFENNPVLFFWSWVKIKRLGLTHAEIQFGSFWSKDLKEFDGVVVFGMTHIMERLEKKLEKELKPGSIVISNIFKFPNWPVEREESGVRVYRRPH
jgi:SAM-dependent methyltransferase